MDPSSSSSSSLPTPPRPSPMAMAATDPFAGLEAAGFKVAHHQTDPVTRRTIPGEGVWTRNVYAAPKQVSEGVYEVDFVMPCNGHIVTLACMKSDPELRPLLTREYMPGTPETGYSVRFAKCSDRATEEQLARMPFFTFKDEKAWVAVPYGTTYRKMTVRTYLREASSRLVGRLPDGTLDEDIVSTVCVMHRSVASYINDAAYSAKTAQRYAQLSAHNNVEFLPIIGDSGAFCGDLGSCKTVVAFGVFACQDIRPTPEGAFTPLFLGYGFEKGVPARSSRKE